MKIASRSLIKQKTNPQTKTCRLRQKNPSANVLIKTSKGNIKIKLYKDEAPNTVLNFLRYVKNKQYNDTIFHRIISNFMIQGGEYKEDGEQNKPEFEPIKLEIHPELKNKKGTIAMARTNHKDSAKAQFFINVRDNNNLNEKYAVFGEVTEGMDVVNEIRISKTNEKNWPNSPTKILEILGDID